MQHQAYYDLLQKKKIKYINMRGREQQINCNTLKVQEYRNHNLPQQHQPMEQKLEINLPRAHYLADNQP